MLEQERALRAIHEEENKILKQEIKNLQTNVEKREMAIRYLKLQLVQPLEKLS